MQNIKKTIRSILKKFETLDDYEKRKIVFWYDKDETADDEELETIKSALVRECIKLYRLKALGHYYPTNCYHITTPICKFDHVAP